MKNTLAKPTILIFVICLLSITELFLLRISPETMSPGKGEKVVQAYVPSRRSVHSPHTDSLTFLAFGDINLGRWIGQKIIHGDTNYPFGQFYLGKDSADFIFANLESIISDQNGRTGDPKHNLIFNGPPQGISILKRVGINIVSTANNHEFDYHKEGVVENIARLTNGGILFAGSNRSKQKVYDPIIIEKNNIKIAIFAVTAFMNYSPKGWKDIVAFADTNRLFPAIRKIRNTVDAVIVSYHGGVEYADSASITVKTFSEECIRNGVTLFVGHHPHVTFGIQQFGNAIIVQSLGNFVFYQPQHYWTQRSYGVKFNFSKIDSIVSIHIERIVPLKVGPQTMILKDSVEKLKLFTRTQKLSNIDLTQVWE